MLHIVLYNNYNILLSFILNNFVLWFIILISLWYNVATLIKQKEKISL